MIFFKFTCKYCKERLPKKRRAPRMHLDERSAPMCRSCWSSGADMDDRFFYQYIRDLEAFEAYKDRL